MSDETPINGHTLTSSAYWKLRYLQACAERDELQGFIRAQRAADAYRSALRSAGYSETQPLKWNDEAERLDPMDAEPTPPGE